MTDKIDFETDPPITPIKTVGFVNLKAGAAMTRYEAIEKALEACLWEMKTVADTLRMYQEYHGCIDQAKAAIALPEDSKTVNAELYGLAIELCDRYMRSEIESLCVNTGSTGFKLDARKPWYQDEVNEAVRYISLREASGEPMPYKVVRDGDKVRFV